MSDRTIVMVSDLDDAKHGEINVMEDATQAARLVESLLESGFDQTRIRIFPATKWRCRLPTAPWLPSSAAASRPTATGPRRLPKRSETEAQIVIEEPDQLEDEVVAPKARARQPVAVGVAEKESATPFVRDGVKFSSLFRPA